MLMPQANRCPMFAALDYAQAALPGGLVCSEAQVQHISRLPGYQVTTSPT